MNSTETMICSRKSSPIGIVWFEPNPNPTPPPPKNTFKAFWKFQFRFTLSNEDLGF